MLTKIWIKRNSGNKKKSEYCCEKIQYAKELIYEIYVSYLLCGGDDCWGHQPAGGGDLRGRWGRVARWRRASRGMASSKVGFFLLPKDSEPQPQPSPRSGFIFRSIFCPGCLTLSVSLKIEIILTFIRKWLITNANLKAKVWIRFYPRQNYISLSHRLLPSRLSIIRKPQIRTIIFFSS